MNRLVFRVLSVMAVAGILALGSRTAEAYQVKRVIHGQMAMGTVEIMSLDLADPNGDLNYSDGYLGSTPTYLDPSKCIVLITNTTTSDRAIQYKTFAVLDDERTLTCIRYGTVATTVEFMIVEFVSGVTVTTGLTVFPDGTSTVARNKTITLPQSLDLTKSLAIVNNKAYTGNSASTDENYQLTVTFTAANKLYIQRGDSANTYFSDAYYQVIEFDEDVFVQYGSAQIASQGTSPVGDTVTVNLNDAPTYYPVDPAKSVLFMSSRNGTGSAGDEGIIHCSGVITDANTLTFRRNRDDNANNDQIDIQWFVVEFEDETYVQSGEATVNTGNGANLDTAISAIVKERSFVRTSVHLVANADLNAGLDDVSVRASLSTTTNLRLVRQITTQTFDANVAWFVTELPPLKVTSPNGGEVWNVGDVENITWQHAMDLESGGSCSGTNHTLDIEVWVNGAWRMINSSTCANADTYAWTIPATLSSENMIRNDLKVRVKSQTLGSRNFDVSNADFQIKGKVNITSPVGSEEWEVGSNQSITWTNSGDFNGGGFKGTISYSTAGSGGPWTVINNDVSLGTGSGGTLAWNPVPDILGTNTYVRIALNNEVAPVETVSTSPAAFSVKRQLALVNPGMGAGESYTAQTPWDIRWTYKGQQSWGTVKIQASTDAAHNLWSDIATGEAVGGGTGDTPPYAGTGEYTGDISSSLAGTTVRVRVVSETDGTVLAASTNDFSVVPKITVTQPSSGTYYVDDNTASTKIMWTLSSALSPATVKLTYSTDGGGTFPNVIVASAQADNVDATHGERAWAIPDNVNIGDTVVRVEHTADANLYGDSAQFTIKGKIDTLTPDGGEVYVYGSNIGISWAMHGTYAGDAFKIYLSSNGGTSFPTLLHTTASAPSGNNNWTWATGTQASATNYQVKVTLASDEADVAVDSQANFRIKPVLSLTAPDGGEVWKIGSEHDITWTKAGSTDSIDLHYSTDSGGTYPNAIVTAHTDPSPYPWTLPDGALSPDLRVRIKLNGDATVSDESANDLKGEGSLILTSPNTGNEIWDVGTVQNITWTSTPLVQGNAELFYSTDGGSTYPDPANLITTEATSDQSYAWTIPDAIGTNVKVKIVGVNDATVNDESNTAFKIRAKFTLTAPNGGGTWVVGANESITWNTAGTVANVNLFKSVNSGGDWTSVASGLVNTGSYAWGVSGGVADTIGTTNRIKVEDAADATAFDASNADYTIKGSVTLTSPNGGTTLTVGGSHLITWTKTGTLGNVKVLYSTDGGGSYPDPANLIGTVPASDLNISWNPISDAITENLKIKVMQTGAAPNDAFDESNAVNSLKGSLTLTAPNGGENFFVGQNHNITWTKTGTLGNVKLVYSTDGGATYPEPDNVIASGVPASDLSYTWNVADAIDSDIRVKIILESDSAVADASNANFNVKGSLTLTDPDGGESWEVGSSQAITWTRNGASMGNIKLEYSTNGGSTYPNLIATDVASGALSYAWTVPDAIDTDIRVKITSLQDADTTDASAANFEIKGKLTLTAPNGGQTLIVGAAQNITWTTAGTVANVNLHYSTNSGGAYGNAIASNIPNSSPYAWTVPDAIGTQLRVRVQNAADTNVGDASDSDFTIKGSLTLTSPNGGNTLIVGANHSITWTKTGSLGLGDILLSVNGGSNYTVTVAEDVTLADLNYSWTVPDNMTGNAMIKIMQAADLSPNNAFDESNAVFNIKGSLTLTAPNGAEEWGVGSAQNITWTKTGSLGNIKILYSTDGGATYPDPDNVIIASTPAADLSYAWTVTDAIDTDIRVRIELIADTAVNDQSNANFKIKGTLTLGSLTGGGFVEVGSSQAINWTRNGNSMGNINIDYSTNSGSTYPNSIVAGVASAALTYNWTIPDDISNTVRVKLTLAADPATSSASGSDFAIRGKLTMTSPNGAETWYVGENRNITWTTSGTIATIKLYYSTDGGGTYPNAITGAIANASPYAWTVPDAIGTQLRVKVENTGDTNVSDASNADFTVKGTITVTSPNGGETLPVAGSHLITWTKTGTLGTVDIKYSTNGGSSFDGTVATLVPSGDLNYNWTNIPDAISAGVQVRVFQTAAVSPNNASDDSDANCAIKGTLTITAPNGGQTWYVGQTQNITWTKTGTLGNAKLVYSVDGGATYPEPDNVIAATVAAADLTYEWTVPDAIDAEVRVKIILLADSTVQDASNANFSIKGVLALTAPNAAVSWTVASNQNITWTRTGSIVNVKLEYTKNGTDYTLIIGSTSGAALSYGWAVPDNPSDTVKVRISDASDAAVTDSSDNDFKIKPALDLTDPDGGESWVVGSAYDITWTKTGTIANVKISYSTDAGATFPNTIIASTPAGALTYEWTIPDSITSQGRVRIEKVGDDTVKDDSGANFAIKGSLTITYPNGNESLGINNSYNVTWTKTGSVGNCKIEYSTDGGASYPNTVVASVAGAAGTYAWTIPDNPTVDGRVKITELSNSTVNDASNADFDIVGTLFLGAPNGGQTWIVGATENVTWTKFGAITNVNLTYSTNSGGAYGNVIANGVSAAALSYAWTIPDAIGTGLRVKITDADNASVNDASEADFTIKGSVTLTAPNGSENWVVGESRNITWTKTGSIGNVKLEYSVNAGGAYPNTIVASVPGADLTYAWTVADAIGTQLRVKITALSDGTVTDASADNFTVRGQLTLTAPNGTEVWIVGASENITWSRVGSIANAKLEYSTDGGATYPNEIIASTPAAAGTYAWTIPDAISNQVRVRISDASDATVLDGSNANLTIRGSLTITAPNGGQTWVVNEERAVTWTKTGTFANVKLEYSTDGGSTYPNEIIASTGAVAGTYTWTVPDSISSTVKVKVTNLSDANVSDASNTNFAITGSLALTAPNGAEPWKVGDSESITWTKVGSIANVKLEYSTNGGGAYPNQIIASTPAGALSYSWTIPDAITQTARVRISDAANAAVNDTSDANFQIQPKLTLTVPDGGEVWVVGDSQDITWTETGSEANVKLEYSTDGGNTYPNVISASTPNTGSYSWTIPDAITTGARVQISALSNAAAKDNSTNNFKIRGSLTLTAPNGNESWDVADVENITWTKVGTIATVKLEYSVNGGGAYPNLIVNDLDATSSPYAWTVPDAISTTVRVKVTHTGDATVNDASDSNLTIKGAFTLTAPNGGQNWTVGTGQNITWTRFGTIPTAELRYSTNSGSSYPNVIVASTDASTGTYSWTIPDALSTSVRVKITDTGNANVSDTSNADFTIQGALEIVVPNGGQVWVVGASQNITWTRTGSIANVKLEYSTNAGVAYPNLIVGGTDASALSYAWTIPDAVGSELRVKITDAANANVIDTSNGNFTIKGSLTITAPNGAETWFVGASQNITWSRTGTIPTVKLEYSTNGGTNFPNTITASTDGSTGSYAWTIPDAIGTAARVRITNTDDATVTDDSNADFTIKGSITVTSPNGTEAWVVNSAHNITWNKTGTMANVQIDYSTDAGGTYPNSISASTDAATGSFAWTVPDNIDAEVRVRVMNLSDNTVVDTSDANFKIVGSFTLTAPNGGQLWKVGTNQNVTWTKVGSVANAKLEYSTNGGGAYPNTIIASTPAGALSYTWAVPDSLTTTARVRISDAADATVLDTSDANFQIIASLTITAPDGGEVWTVGSSQDITWNRVGSAATVKLEYSTNGGGAYPNEITASTGNTGTFSWTVPDSISSLVKVKVTDTTNPNATDESTDNFKIRGALVLTAPNGTEVWGVASVQNITWTRTGTITTVKLEYSTDSGTSYPNLINGAVDGSALTYAWTVPDALTANARVKITDASDATVLDSSNANFRISGSVTVTSPNGTETWNVASAHNITWTKVGSIANVKIELSTDGGGSYPIEIIDSVQASDLLFAWTVPDNITTQARVKISDVSYAGANDVSNANFKIQGVLTVTSPNGSETWNVASVHAITWTKQGTISTVKLEYSTNGGAAYPNTIIASTGAAALSYDWTVPDSIGTQVRVKITNLSDSAVNDESDANFKIAGVLALTSPIGGEVWSVGTSEAISWTRTGSIANAKLEYSTNGGVDYDTVIIASTPANALSYSWTIPDSVSASVRVKLSDVADATVFDTSDANFKIRGSFTLTSPNGTEGWVIGTQHAVTWTKTGTIANAKLEYSKDSGTNYPFVIIGSVAAANLTYNWTIPDDASTQVRVKISQVGDATVFDTSDANLTIRAGFTVTSPVGGEVWAVGSTHDITWTTGGTVPNVKLQYSTDGGAAYPNTIAASVVNTGTYTWSVPDALTTTARVRVQDVNDAAATDASPANFKIHGTFTVTYPNGGEALLVGASANITWTKTGSIANAKLEYSTNAGAAYPNLIIASTSASALSYAWTVPDAIGTQLRVKITDVTDSVATDASNGNFSIKATFTLTAPNGSEAWTVAGSQNITWGTSGTVANVKLEYATDGGTAYSTIIASVANAGSYAWTIPDAITTQGRVRISDVNDSSAFDVSDANFKIKGSLTLTAPNGAEKWNVGTARMITWDRVGSIPNVKLEYSSNNGGVYVPIIASTGNTGAYSWTIPDAITVQALVRVTDVNDNTVVDVSNAVFKIMGNFTVTFPNGGEVLTVTSAQNITWTSSGTMAFAKLEYTTNGTDYTLITGSTDNNGLYAWTVPDAVSGTVKVRVSDPNDADANDQSNANFRIRAVMALTAPNGAQKWTVGRPNNITWTTVGTIPNVKLQYSRDGFLADIIMIDAATPNDGVYSWTLPDTISNTVRVRVSDPNDIGALDDSNADFKIMGGYVVTSPNGAEMWDVATAYNITWTQTGTVADALIEYSTNGGANYSAVIQTENDGSYSWTVPDSISATARIRISDPADADANDSSDANFKIRAKFTLSAPNGAEIWTVGDANNVTWNNTGTVANVKLDYSTDSGASFPNAITATTGNTGTYSWTVPDSISTLVRVRVTSTTDSDAYDDSNADFKIRGKFVVTAPNGAEQWRISQVNNITWTTTGTIPNVKLYYSTNQGSTYPNVIINSVANANSYAWTIPDVPTTQARVRVENVTDATVYDDSNANFSIQGFFTLTAPNGAEQWEVATAHNITWTWGGTIPNVKLSYSTTSGAAYPNVITASTANGVGSSGNHSYSWTIPDNISSAVRVKIEDVNDAAVNDTSDADLKIIAKFTVTAPNGAERWVTNETRNITWTTNGTVPNVKLAYSHDDFQTSTVITASTNNAGTYAWTVPDPGVANVPKTTKVRVMDIADNSINDSSDAAFNIDYYITTWDVRDLLTNAPLSGLTALGVKSTDLQNVIWSEAGISANPPRVQPMPYGTWVVTWTKSGYGDVAVTVVADQDRPFTTANGNPVLMETSTVHIWESASAVTYNPVTTTADVAAWLQRDGSIVSGAVLCTFYIYNGPALVTTLSDNTVDANGFFQMTIPAGTLSAGVAYTTVTAISNAAGGVFRTPGSFEITTPETLQNLKEDVAFYLDKPLSQVSQELNTTLAAQTVTITEKLDDQTDTINVKLDAQTAAIQNTLDNFTALVSSSITDLQDAADLAQDSAQNLEDTALRYSWKATVTPNPALHGQKIQIQVQGPAGLKPELTVYNHKNEAIIKGVELEDDADQPGFYLYEVDAKTLDPVGGNGYSGIVVEEVVTFGLATFSGQVTATTLDQLMGVASGATAAKTAAEQARDAIIEMQATMAKGGNVLSALKNLQKSVNELPAEVAKVSGGDTKRIRSTVNAIAEQIQRLAGSEGLDMSQIVGEAISENASIQEIQQRAGNIQLSLEVLGGIVEKKLGGADQPIVATFLEAEG